MKGIRGRLAVSFMIVILVSAVVLEMLLINTVKQNYYGSLNASLTNQVKISADMYSRYYSDSSLEDNILYNVDAFWNQSNARVEIVDRNGNIIMDSLGTIPAPDEPDSDIIEALNDKTGEWVGKLSGHNVMVVAYPLKSNGQIVGALRLIASTDSIDQDIESTTRAFILIGLFVVLIAFLLSIFLANTILIPLKEVTSVAEGMAAGDLQIKYRKKRNDEIGKLADTLNYMAGEITKREILKNDFISSVSHELRTPLTSIKGWAITLQSEKFQDKDTLNDGLVIIEEESERLTLLVEELLDFSKFISGRIKLEYKAVNLIDLLKYIQKQLTPRAERNNIDFILSYPESLPDIYSDANRLIQLFINILDNAFNFTDAGGYVRFQADIFEHNYVFTISDNGCGIAADELPLVKEKFYKGKGAGSKNGIGLSLCEEIVTLMGGRLEIKSELGVGTVAIVTLPLEEQTNV